MRYVRVPVWVFRSAAWTTLSMSARVLLMDAFRLESAVGEEGATFALLPGTATVGVSRKTFWRAKKELVVTGWLERRDDQGGVVLRRPRRMGG